MQKTFSAILALALLLFLALPALADTGRWAISVDDQLYFAQPEQLPSFASARNAQSGAATGLMTVASRLKVGVPVELGLVLARALDRHRVFRTVSLYQLDGRNVPVLEIRLTDVEMIGFSMPAIDSTSRNAQYLSAEFDFRRIQVLRQATTTALSPLQGSPLMGSNVRVYWNDRAVTGFHLEPWGNQINERAPSGSQRGSLNWPPMEMSVRQVSDAGLPDWLADFEMGRSRPQIDQKTVKIDFLDARGSQLLFRISTTGVNGAQGLIAGADGSVSSTVSLYVASVSFESGGAVGAANPAVNSPVNNDTRNVNSIQAQNSQRINPDFSLPDFQRDPSYNLYSRPGKGGAAELEWKKPAQVDSKLLAGYHLYRSESTKGLLLAANRIRSNLVGSYATVEKTGTGLYYYAVQAVLKDGTLAQASDPVPVLVRNQTLAATGPAYNLTSRPDKTGSAFLDWNKPKGPDEKPIATYNIYRSDTVEDLVQEPNRILTGVHGTGTVVEKVTPGLYYYAVEAVRKDGTALPPSDPLPVLVLDHDEPANTAATGQTQNEPAPAGPGGRIAEGEKIFAANCQSCHGKNGDAGVQGGMKNAANFANLEANPPRIKQILLNLTVEDHSKVVKLGGAKSGVKNATSAMPGFGTVLSDQQIADVVAYERALPAFKNSPR